MEICAYGYGNAQRPVHASAHFWASMCRRSKARWSGCRYRWIATLWNPARRSASERPSVFDARAISSFGMSFAGSKTSSTTTYRGSAVNAKLWTAFCSNVSVFLPPAVFVSTRAPAEPTTNLSGSVIATFQSPQSA